MRLSNSSTPSAGVDILTNLLDDDNKAVRAAAMEVYIRRVYRTYAVPEIKVKDIDGRLSRSFEFEFADVPIANRVTCNGFFSVMKDAGNFASEPPDILKAMGSTISGAGAAVGPDNVL